MDMPHEKRDGMTGGGMHHGGAMGHCCHGHHGGVLSVFARGFLMVLVLVMAISFIASFFGMRGWHMGGYGIPGGMMGRWSVDRDNARVFGVIKKIDGATITILDNGNTERSVVSTASTIITDGDTELSVGDLKVGERIGVTGTSDNKVLTAKLIEVVI